MISEEFLDILACPDCQNHLVLKTDKLYCEKCQREYSFNQDIVALMPSQESAEKIKGRSS